MIKRESLFTYRPGTTAIHNLPAPVKLVLLVLFSAAVSGGPRELLSAVSIVVLLAACVARLSAASVRSVIRIVIFYGLFIAVFSIGSGVPDHTYQERLHSSILYLWRLATLVTAGSIFYETTSGSDVRHCLYALQKKCETLLAQYTGHTVRFPDIALLLSLTVSFIPRIFSTWDSLNSAWIARGGCKNGPRKMGVLLPLLLIRLLYIAADTDRAVRNRT